MSWWSDRKIDSKTLRALLAEVWVSEDAPGLRHEQSEIVGIFRAAGFVSDSVPKKRRPRKPLLVYRGCHPAVARGLAWSLDQKEAKWFATEYHELAVVRALLADPALKLAPPQAGRLYRTMVMPNAVLAILHGRNETEIIVDPSMLGEVEEII
jgi:hypothetical protein